MKLTSAFHKISICAAWAALAFIAFATLSPIQDRPTLAGPLLEHFGAFAAMGCAFVFAYPRRTPIIIAIVVGSAFGLEALQLLTPDRHGRTIDALAKAAGGLGGIGIGRLSASWSAPAITRSFARRVPRAPPPSLRSEAGNAPRGNDLSATLANLDLDATTTSVEHVTVITTGTGDGRHSQLFGVGTRP